MTITDVALRVFDPDNRTLRGTLTSARGIRWVDDLTSPGSLAFTYDPDDDPVAAWVVADAVIRVHDLETSTDLFAASVRTRRKRRPDDGPEIAVTCVGLRALLGNIVLYPHTVYGGRTRIFGWQAPDLYDDTAWTAPTSHGTHADDPFGDLRPEEWPSPTSEYIWDTHSGGTAAPGDVYFRRTFTTAATQDVVVAASADDHYTLYLDGQELLANDRLFGWRRYESTSFALEAGEHVIAVRARNLWRPTTGNSLAWLMAAVLDADPDGTPDRRDETWTVHTGDATGGTFALTYDGALTTAPIAYDASPGEVESALEATSAFVEVIVEGSGTTADPWVITTDGIQRGAHHTLAGDGAALTGGTGLTIVNTVDGRPPTVIVETDDTWQMLAYPDPPPGLTFGAAFSAVLEEARRRGALGHLTYSFDGDDDSQDDPWTTLLEVAVTTGTPYDQIVRVMEDAGLDVHLTPSGVIRAAEDLGTDRTATVTLEAGVNVTDSQHTRDGWRLDRLLVETVEGYAEREVASPGTPLREGYAQAGAFPSVPAFDAYAADMLRSYAGEADSGTFDLAETDGVPRPYVDFAVGDLVEATSWDDTLTAQRVLMVAGQVVDGGVEWTVETDDQGTAT